MRTANQVVVIWLTDGNLPSVIHVAPKECTAVKTLLASMLLISWAGMSHAGTSTQQQCTWNERLHRLVCVHSAPEYDVKSLAAGLTLCLGGLAVLRGRRAKGAASL